MPDEFDGILEEAINQPVGCVALCSSAEAADKLRRLLYVRRAQAREGGDFRFDCLSMSLSPHSGEILYIYRKQSDEPQE